MKEHVEKVENVYRNGAVEGDTQTAIARDCCRLCYRF